MVYEVEVKRTQNTYDIEVTCDKIICENGFLFFYNKDVPTMIVSKSNLVVCKAKED